MTPPRGQSPQSRASLPSVPRFLPPDYYSRGQASAAGIPAAHPSVPRLLLSGAGIPASLPSVIPAAPSVIPAGPLCHSRSSKRESSVFASPTSQSPSSCLKRASAPFPLRPLTPPSPARGEGERSRPHRRRQRRPSFGRGGRRLAQARLISGPPEFPARSPGFPLPDNKCRGQALRE